VLGNLALAVVMACEGNVLSTISSFSWAIIILFCLYVSNKKDVDEWRRKKIEGE
jgi:hypothetical protein